MNSVPASVPVLRWAAQRARLPQADLEARFPKWPLWLTGQAQPPLKQLEDFARLTHTAFGYFFLPEPPRLTRPVPDYRTLRDEVLAEPSTDLLDTLYLCQQRQDWYREHARLHGLAALPFVGSAGLHEAPQAVARRLREKLALSADARRESLTWADALRQMIACAEDAGVLVMASSVVGSNSHRKLDVGELRGFALADDLAPLVFVNGADSKAAQMFTLAHELAHLWLGESGISDPEAAEAPNQAVERWCNRVAAEMLVPLSLFSAEHDPETDLRGELDRLSRRFKVSTLVVLRRMHDAGRLTGDAYWRAYNSEVDRLQALSGGSGGNFYLTLGARVSKRFARAVVSSTLEGRSTFTEAFRLLGFKKMSTFNELSTSLGVPM